MNDSCPFQTGMGSVLRSFCLTRHAKPDGSFVLKSQLGIAVSAALGLSLFAGQACAQDDQTEYDEELALEEVVVTGTRSQRDSCHMASWSIRRGIKIATTADPK